MTPDRLTGRLLLATPDMGDPRFEHAVIFICQHDEDGAMGVIVNKPLAELDLGELLDQLEIAPREGVRARSVMFGGPVHTERGVVLHSLDYRLDETMPVTADIGLSTTREALVDLAGLDAARHPPKNALLALGYAGWGAGQLDGELAQNAWQVCDADPALLFELDRARVWNAAFAKLGVSAAMFSEAWSSTGEDDRTVH